MPRLKLLFITAAWMVTAAVVASRIGVVASTVSAAAAAVAACLLAQRWRGVPARLPVVWILAAGAAGAAVLLSAILRDALPSTAPAWTAWSAVTAIETAGCTFALAIAFRISANRRPVFGLAEAAALASVFVYRLMASRDGFVNRPYEFADPLIAQGWDPLQVSLALGAGIAGFVTLWLLVLRKGSRTRDLALPLLLSLCVFLAIPAASFRRNLWSGGGGGSQRRPPEVTPNEKPKPIAVVRFDDSTKTIGEQFYFRQAVLDRFDGRRFVRSSTPVRKDDARHSGPIVHTTVALLADHSDPFELVNGLSVKPVPNPDPSRFVRAYEVESAPAGGRLTLMSKFTGIDWSARELKDYLETSTDPSYRLLEDRILQSVPDFLREYPAYRVAAISEWMDANVTYSLTAMHDGPDPIAHFLFGDRRGKCTDFAHSAVMLYRLAGVPARVATGYMVTEQERQGQSSVVVTLGDAHAWPEIHVRGSGWVPLDVAAKKSELPPVPPVHVDPKDIIREWPTPEGNPAKAASKQTAFDLRRAVLAVLEAAAKLLGWATLALLAAAYATRLWRAGAPRWCGERFLPALAYRSALDGLAEAGLLRRQGQSREAFAADCGLPAFADISRLHLGWALGSRGPAVNREQWLALAGQSRREAWRRASWRGKLQGLSPFRLGR